ncbi:hypothetical protein Hanom_Chr16g01419011 [Helianthus anomalus]
MNYQTQTNMSPNVHEHKRTNVTSVRVRLFNKQMNTNELSAKRFTNCSPNIWFVCNPIEPYSCYFDIKVLRMHAFISR